MHVEPETTGALGTALATTGLAEGDTFLPALSRTAESVFSTLAVLLSGSKEDAAPSR
jgi:hypothetical protein